MGDIKDKIFIATFSAAAPKTAKEFGVGLELNDLCISSNLEPERRERVVKRMYAELVAAGREGKRTIMHGPFTELTPDSIDPRAKAVCRMGGREILRRSRPEGTGTRQFV